MEEKIKETKQKIVAVIIMLFMFLMVTASLEIKNAIAVNNQTNLLQNITAGTLTIVVFPNLGFNDTTAGTSQNSLANLGFVNIRNYLGNGAQWSATASSSNFVNGAGGTRVIANNRLGFATGDIFAYNGASNTGVAVGPDYSGNFGDGPRTVANAATNAGQGAYNLYNNTLNLLIQAADYAENYNATMTFTIS